MAMAKLDPSSVKHVAHLARLPLNDNEIKLYSKQLSEVVSYIDQLNEVDTDNIEPTSQTTGLTNVTRNDEIDAVSVLTADEALSGTDKTHNGYFVVPMLLTNRDE